jgi:hypothetical protein
VSRAEHGTARVTPNEAEAWARECGATDDEIRELRDLAQTSLTLTVVWRQAPGGLKEAQQSLLIRERRAGAITALSIAAVNGLAQTEDYMRALFAMLDWSHANVEEGILARLARQGAAHAGTRPITMMHTEGALRARYGSVEMHAAQLDHLANLTHPHMRVGVIPFAVQAPIVYASRICLYTDFLEGEPDEVEVEAHTGEVLSTDPGTVARYRRRLDLAAGAALWGDEAREFIQRIAAELRHA